MSKLPKNNQFTISLQYLKKKVSDESFLHIDALIFDGDGQAIPKFPK